MELKDALLKMIAEHKAAKNAMKKIPAMGRPGRKPSPVVAKTPPRADAPDAAHRAWQLSTRWTSQHIAILLIDSTCQHCGHTQTSSSPYPMIVRFHPVFGKHITVIAPHEPEYTQLPRKVERVSITATSCVFCWLVSETDRNQPSLPIFPENQGTLPTLGLLTDCNAVHPAHRDALEGLLTTTPRPARKPHYYPLAIIEESLHVQA